MHMHAAARRPLFGGPHLPHFAKRRHFRRRGAGLVIALVTLLVIMSIMGTIIQSLLAEFRQCRQAATELQANCLADAALARAVAQLQANPQYESETWRPELAATGSNSENSGVAEIRIERNAANAEEVRLTVAARFPDHPWRRVVASRTRLISPSNKKSAAGTAPQETAP